ncbi:CvpA family protein [Gracilibacillus alcaliphilus]|uniref:CvpA family protein n=1 Tax=Gracilibacillus alcaliphilus TaxID=1401441 RepID=UPI0019584DA7|nr:CvpA family protein [Gracilibacillus alcaliphilus]MBM7676955.1 putative membrane protein required for colicin V production [Gracilibacillus alcaliphilus]
MVNLILIILFLIGILVGLRRGLILQFLHLTSFIIAFIVAARYYDNVASKLELWIPYPEMMSGSTWAIFGDMISLEAAYYNAIAFGGLFIVTKIVLQIVATMLDFVADIPILRSINNILGAVLGFLEVYLVVFILLYIFALAPVSYVQDYIDQSGIAKRIVEHTPVLTDKVTTYLFENDPLNND